MLWNAYLYDPKTRTKMPLGHVRAKWTPSAKLHAIARFKIPAAHHRYLGVEPVVPPLLRRISTAMNAALRKKPRP